MTIRTKFNFIRLALFLALPLSAQNASDYFPSTTGNAWHYQEFDLDTNQAVIQSSKRIVTDSLVGAKLISGINSYILKTVGSAQRDSTFIAVSGDSINFFNRSFPQQGLATVSDSLGSIFTVNFSGWYSYYKFASPPQNGTVDTILYRDTSAVFESTEVALTFIATRKRLAAKTISVPAGTYSATPYVITLSAHTYYLFSEVPLLQLTDTFYVSKSNWIVKEVQKSSYFPVQPLPVEDGTAPSFRIPGYVRLLEKEDILSVEQSEVIPAAIELEQNYPNPFNPATEIRYQTSESGRVTLTVYDVLGRQVAVLVNEQKRPGTYGVTFDGSSLPSSVYFYRLMINGNESVKKMILQK